MKKLINDPFDVVDEIWAPTPFIADVLRPLTDKPVLVGFGVSTPEQAVAVAVIAAGEFDDLRSTRRPAAAPVRTTRRTRPTCGFCKCRITKSTTA